MYDLDSFWKANLRNNRYLKYKDEWIIIIIINTFFKS